MAHSLSYLLSSEAAGKRISFGHVLNGRQPKFVVHVEIDSDMSVADRFIEFDADSIEHAGNIANVWLNNMRGVSAAIRRVMPDGTLHDPCAII